MSGSRAHISSNGAKCSEGTGSKPETSVTPGRGREPRRTPQAVGFLALGPWRSSRTVCRSLTTDNLRRIWTGEPGNDQVYSVGRGRVAIVDTKTPYRSD